MKNPSNISSGESHPLEIMSLVDEFAEARHKCGAPEYNSTSNLARLKVVKALAALATQPAAPAEVVASMTDEQVADLWEDHQLPPCNTHSQAMFARAVLALAADLPWHLPINVWSKSERAALAPAATEAPSDPLPRYILWDSKHPDYPVEWTNPGRPPRDGEIGFFRHDIVNELLDEQRAALASPAPSVGEPVATLRFQRGTPGHENDMPEVVSCNWMPDGVYPVYLATPPAAPAAAEVPSLYEQRRAQGYAPGGYMCKCAACENMFQGDKRAWTCESCADKAIATPAPAVGASLTELRAAVTNALNEARAFGWVNGKRHNADKAQRCYDAARARLDAAIDALAAVGASVQPVPAATEAPSSPTVETCPGAPTFDGSAAYVLILCFGPKFMGMCASGQELLLVSQQQCQEAKAQYSPQALGNGGYAVCIPHTTKRRHNGQELPLAKGAQHG